MTVLSACLKAREKWTIISNADNESSRKNSAHLDKKNDHSFGASKPKYFSMNNYLVSTNMKKK